MHVHFISSKDTGETHTIFVWNDNEEISSGNETDDNIRKEVFKCFLNNYQKEEIILRKGSDFILESVDFFVL